MYDWVKPNNGYADELIGIGNPAKKPNHK